MTIKIARIYHFRVMGVIAAFALFLCAAATKRPTDNGIQFAGIKLSYSGLLFLDGSTYRIVTKDRYPAHLNGVFCIDLDHRVYVARFFEPAGIGAESYYDVCFQIRDGKPHSYLVDPSAGVERLGDKTAVRSCSYVYDRERKVLMLVSGKEGSSSEVRLGGVPTTIQ